MPLRAIERRALLIRLQVRVDELYQPIQILRRDLGKRISKRPGSELSLWMILRSLPSRSADQNSIHSDSKFPRIIPPTRPYPCMHLQPGAHAVGIQARVCHHGRAKRRISEAGLKPWRSDGWTYVLRILLALRWYLGSPPEVASEIYSPTLIGFLQQLTAVQCTFRDQCIIVLFAEASCAMEGSSDDAYGLELSSRVAHGFFVDGKRLSEELVCHFLEA